MFHGTSVGSLLRARGLGLALVAALTAAPVLAQGGGFSAGDLYLYSASVDAPGGGGPSVSGLVHVDLLAGTANLQVPTTSTGQSAGSVVFDPYRQRIVFDGKLEPSVDPSRLWAMDAAGNLEVLSTLSLSISALAPTGDGRIYFRAAGTGQPFRYLDANNDVQTLLDETGTVPYLMDGNFNFNFNGLIYDAGTNALILSTIVSNFCAGGVNNRLNIRKLPLSADGTRVGGPYTCAQYEVSTSSEGARGFSHGPGGMLVLVVDTNSSDEEPRMLLVDPVTLDITPFASNGPYTGAGATDAGSWCSALNRVVILDTFSDDLRAFGFGEVGEGILLSPSGSVSSTGGSSEAASMVEVPPSSCSGAWMAYGAGLAGQGGFTPRLLGEGCPDIGGTLTLVLDRALGAATGFIFAGASSAALPFRGGTFHVGDVVLNLPITLGGAAGVSGAGLLQLSTPLNIDPQLAGFDIFMQAAYADAAAVKGASLTKGLRMTLGD